ncbi:MAG: HAD family phosphatase [Oscillospiraceae bacterium]|nr:HAD family phosphatase [Oscillospiraceae bacterium]
MAFEIYRKEWGIRPIRGVLFDMDGLVVNTEILYSRFWMEACQFYGFPMTYEQSLSMRALNRTAGEAMLKHLFGPTIDYLKVRTKRVELMEAFVDAEGVGLKPGIRELLCYLEEKGIATAITSSSPVPRIQKYLGFHGLENSFHKLCSGRDVPTGKPAPDIYLHGAASLGLRPEECLALEDAPSGIRSAHAAGCFTVMIPDQDQPDPETAALLHGKADSLADVIGLLEELN